MTDPGMAVSSVPVGVEPGQKSSAGQMVPIDDNTVLHHEVNRTIVLGVLKRIRIQDDEVGTFAALDGSDLRKLSVGRSDVASGRNQRIHWSHAELVSCFQP